MRYPRNMQGYGGQPARRRLARRRQRRRPVRAQLRGGRRELRPARRRRLRGLPLRDRRRPALARPAPLEHGIDLRIRRPRRLLAPAPPFTARAVPVTVYGVATALARSPAQVAAMQEAGWEIASHGLKWIDYRDHTREAEAADIAEAIRLHTEVTGERPARLVHRPLLGQHRRPRHRGRRLRLDLRHLRRRPALLARARRPPAADHPLHPRRQRHALRHAAGLQLRRPLLRLPQGHLRHPLRRRRGRHARR